MNQEPETLDFVWRKRLELFEQLKAATKAKVQALRGTFGFVDLGDMFEGLKIIRDAVVVHVLADGRLIIHYSGNKHFHAIIPPDMLVPSRVAYFSEGSYVEPEWDERCPARCKNVWVTFGGKEDWNVPENVLTDEHALRLFMDILPEDASSREP